MSALSADSIGPKHGSFVRLTNATFESHAAWQTSSSNAEAGPASDTQLATLVISWFTSDGIATISIPELIFTGSGSTLEFGIFAGLPAPAVAQSSVASMVDEGVSSIPALGFTSASVDIAVDSSIVISLVRPDKQGFSDEAEVTLKPFVYSYRV
jgi:hypothetical protein